MQCNMLLLPRPAPMGSRAPATWRPPLIHSLRVHTHREVNTQSKYSRKGVASAHASWGWGGAPHGAPAETGEETGGSISLPHAFFSSGFFSHGKVNCFFSSCHRRARVHI